MQMEEVFGLLIASEKEPKLEKFHFCSKLVDYHVHVIPPGKLQVPKTTTEALESEKYFKDISHMRSSLALCSVYRRFVPGFAEIAAPSNKKLKNEELSHLVLNNQEHRAV